MAGITLGSFNPTLNKNTGVSGSLQGGFGSLQGGDLSLQGSNIPLQGSAPAPTALPKTSTYLTVPSGAGGGVNYGPSIALAGNQAAEQTNLLNTSFDRSLQINDARRKSTIDSAGNRLNDLSANYNDLLAGAGSAYSAGISTSTDNARLTQADIDASLRKVLGDYSTNETQVNENAATSDVNNEQTLRRLFGSRGSLDSTFYANAVLKSGADINGQKNQQVAQIHNAITQASDDATRQKSKVDSDLRTTLANLAQKKSDYIAQINKEYNAGRASLQDVIAAANLDAEQFASEAEIEKMGKLQSIKFNLDNLILGYQNKASEVARSLGKYGKEANSLLANNQFNSDITTSIAQALSLGKKKEELLPGVMQLPGVNGHQQAAMSILDQAEQYLKQSQQSSTTTALQQLVGGGTSTPTSGSGGSLSVQSATPQYSF